MHFASPRHNQRRIRWTTTVANGNPNIPYRERSRCVCPWAGTNGRGTINRGKVSQRQYEVVLRYKQHNSKVKSYVVYVLASRKAQECAAYNPDW